MIDILIEKIGPLDHLIVNADGSVKRGVKSSWWYTASLREEVVKENSGFIAITTSSISMGVQSSSKMTEWF